MGGERKHGRAPCIAHLAQDRRIIHISRAKGLIFKAAAQPINHMQIFDMQPVKIGSQIAEARSRGVALAKLAEKQALVERLVGEGVLDASILERLGGKEALERIVVTQPFGRPFTAQPSFPPDPPVRESGFAGLRRKLAGSATAPRRKLATP